MTYLFIACFLARCALIGARRCSSAKRRLGAAFTSLADSDPGHREARAGRVRQHDKLLRMHVIWFFLHIPVYLAYYNSCHTLNFANYFAYYFAY